jgi:hypothetical protein
MLIRLSRALIWLAACAAIAALIGPEQDGRWLSASAGGLLLAAHAVWRAALRQRRSAIDEEPAPSTHLDETTLLEIAVLSARCCAEADSATGVVDAVARCLKLELGAREACGILLRPDQGAAPLRFGRSARAIVIEVRQNDVPVAVVELGDIALSVAPDALGRLVELVRCQMAEALRRLAASGAATAKAELERAPH